MEFLFAIPVILLPFVMPFITGVMAVSLGRKFWPWFFLGIPLPFVSYGGTSLLTFSVMLFILVRLDADRQMVLR